MAIPLPAKDMPRMMPVPRVRFASAVPTGRHPCQSDVAVEAVASGGPPVVAWVPRAG